MKYYLIEFRNCIAICYRTIRTTRSKSDVEKWVRKWKGINNKPCVFIQAKEVTYDDWNSFIECFRETERQKIINECTLL